MNFTALFCSRPRIRPETRTLIGGSCRRMVTWVAVRCRSCRPRRLGLSSRYSCGESLGAGMNVSRIWRHRCQPSHVVRSGGGPVRRNGTIGLSSPAGGSAIVVLPGLIVLGQEEHLAFPEAGPERGRDPKGGGRGPPPAASLGVDAVLGLRGPLRPLQRGHCRLFPGNPGGRRCRAVGFG